jgi:hypothetical protein
MPTTVPNHLGKLTDLQKRLVDQMQLKGKLVALNLHSWEKRSCIDLTKKGIFEEEPSEHKDFRIWVMTDPIKLILNQLVDEVTKNKKYPSDQFWAEAYSDGAKELYKRILQHRGEYVAPFSPLRRHDDIL